MEDMEADPIIEEVRRIRREHAARFGHDLRALAADLRKREQQQPERLVSFPPKPARGKKTAWPGLLLNPRGVVLDSRGRRVPLRLASPDQRVTRAA